MPRRAAPASPVAFPERTLGELAFAGALTLVAAVPFVWDAGCLDAFRGPQGELAVVAWTALAAAFVVTASRSAWRDPWWLAWAGVLVGAVPATLLSGQPVRTLADLLPSVLAALGWGALRSLSPVRKRRLCTLVVAAGVAEGLLTIAFVRPDWQPASFHLLEQAVGRYAWIGTLGNPGYVGFFLALPALLAVTEALASPRRRALHLAAALLMMIAIAGTLTLTAVAAVAAGLLVIAWRRLPARRRVPTVAAAVAVGGLALAVTPIGGRVASAVREARSGGWLWAASGRGAAVAASAAMLEARPLVGVGPGLFEANSFRYQSEDALAQRGHVLGLETGFGEAHNDLLQFAAETGLIGAALAAAGIVLAWRRSRRLAGGVLPDAAPLVVAALLLALTQFPLHHAATAAQWAVIAALALPPLEPVSSGRRAAAWTRLAVAGVLVAGGGILAWRQFDASRAFQQGKLLALELRGSQDPRRGEIARVALGNLERRARWLPFAWDARLILGNLAVAGGEPGEALAHFSAALALADRPEVRFDVGMALLMSGRHDDGVEELLRAVRLNPAVLRSIDDAPLALELRRRLDAAGYGPRHPWIYEGTLAARP